MLYNESFFTAKILYNIGSDILSTADQIWE